MTEIEKEIIPVEIKKDVGIDLGVKSFITKYDSDGLYEKIDNPKFLATESNHLKVLQQKLSRCDKGSSNHKKLKLKISRLHEKIKNRRENFLHNVSKQLVDNYDCIYMEDLNVSGMTKSSKGTIEEPGKMVKQKSGLNRSILDVSMSKFEEMVEYKTKFSGKGLYKVNRFFASSKICNVCGTKNKDLKLSDRNWICEHCGSELDRDENAANNILNEGRMVKIKK
jgi:putative transposase